MDGIIQENVGAESVSIHCFVIGGSMIFTYLSVNVDPNSSAKISAAQLDTGIGFLGTGVILKSETELLYQLAKVR